MCLWWWWTGAKTIYIPWNQGNMINNNQKHNIFKVLPSLHCLDRTHKGNYETRTSLSKLRGMRCNSWQVQEHTDIKTAPNRAEQICKEYDRGFIYQTFCKFHHEKNAYSQK